jgi:hypothetical protein
VACDSVEVPRKFYFYLPNYMWASLENTKWLIFQHWQSIRNALSVFCFVDVFGDFNFVL